MSESDGTHAMLTEAMWFTGGKAPGQPNLGLTPDLVDLLWCGSDQVT